MLLTRAPLYSSPEEDFLVRLACLKHAASVNSEPESNSQIEKKFCYSATRPHLGARREKIFVPRLTSAFQAAERLRPRGSNPSRMIPTQRNFRQIASVV